MSSDIHSLVIKNYFFIHDAQYLYLRFIVFFADARHRRQRACGSDRHARDARVAVRHAQVRVSFEVLTLNNELILNIFYFSSILYIQD